MTEYGVDLACFDDAPGPLFPTVTGLDLVKQDVYHRITNDAVIGWTVNDDGSLGQDPKAENFGLDCRRLLGGATTDASATALGPRISAAIQNSERVETADVKVTRTLTPGGIVVLTLSIAGTAKQTDEPFSFVYHVTATTVSDTFPGAV